MRRWLLLFFVISTPALAQVKIDNPWMRATPPGASVAGGYLTIINTSASADKLVSVSSPASERVETHVHIMDGTVMKMRKVPGLDIPAKGRFELKPGGAHLMFIGVKRPFKEGDTVPVTLKFARGGEVRIGFSVSALGAMHPGHHHGMKH